MIFVITAEGFDRNIAAHFRTLAIEQRRAANMVLVVNKMDMTKLGNCLEQQNIIAQDLAKVTEPYSLQDLYISFLDTQSYFESLNETDAKLKAEFLKMSGHDNFVANLNKFVDSHKILSKIIEPLYTIASEIRNALTGGKRDEDSSKFELTILKRRDIVVEGKNNCLREIQDLTNGFQNTVERLSLEVAQSVIESGNQNDAQNIMKAANDRVFELSRQYNQKINQCIESNFVGVDKTLESYNNSMFVRQVNENLAAKISAENSKGTLIPGGAGAVLGGLIWKYAPTIAAPYAVPQIVEYTTGLTRFTSVIRSAVGKIIGAEFGTPVDTVAGKAAGYVWRELSVVRVPMPTVTNKIADFIKTNSGKIGAAVAILGVAWTVWSYIRSEEERKKREREQKEAQDKIIASFNEIAQDISAQLLSGAQNWINKNIAPIIAKFNEDIQSIHDAEIKSKSTNKKLEELLKRTDKLISEIQIG